MKPFASLSAIPGIDRFKSLIATAVAQGIGWERGTALAASIALYSTTVSFMLTGFQHNFTVLVEHQRTLHREADPSLARFSVGLFRALG